MAKDLIPTDPDSLERARDALDGVAELREGWGSEPAWLVGGAVRDLLLGGSRADLDVVVEGDAAQIAARIGAEPTAHARFGTASVALGHVRVDIASARRETYAHPGALPDVEPATLFDDLARRDFTVNAMALPLAGDAVLVDPHGGLADLGSGQLRVLHPESFEDDPTRALRAARYVARLGLDLEPRTAELLARADLGVVSADRVDAELARLVAEPSGPDALAALSRWGLAGVDEGASDRLRAARELLADPDWAAVVDPSALAAEAARPSDETRRLVASVPDTEPERPSLAMASIAHAKPLGLAMARISGIGWLDRWANEWRKVTLGITGDDLMEAGVAQGPAVGRGLDAALAARLDGEIAGATEELQVALAAAAAT